MTCDGYQNVDRAQFCLLNLIMAFATTHGPSEEPIEVRKARGDVYLERALSLLSHLVLAVDGLESSMLPQPRVNLYKPKLTIDPVQALVMATQYVQGTQSSVRVWELLGRLVSASFQVGMYRNSSASVTQDAVQTELRKRTWWMCFIMDKYVPA